MDQKTIAIVSYITFIGWIIAFVVYNGNTPAKTQFAKFHLRQSLGIFVTAFVLYLIFIILGSLVSIFYLLAGLIGIGVLIFVIIGAINASNGQEKQLPLIGAFADRTFTFIS